MTTLTSSAALPPIVTNPVAVAAEGTPLVLNILAARASGELNSPLVQTLQDAAGPGNVITGTVVESAANGNVTVTTQNGSSVSFHHPPELPLELGSTVVLRLLPTNSTPQAVLLAVNGRPITLRGPAGSGTAASTSPATTATAALPAASAPSTASVAASFIATISLEDEAAIESALDDTGLTLDAASGRASTDAVGPTVIATLIRPAPAKLGQAPVPSGTRYLVTLREVGSADAAAPVTARPTAPASAATPAVRPAAATTLAAAPPIAASLPEPPVSAAATVLLALQQAIEPPAESAPAAPPTADQPPVPATTAATPPLLAAPSETAALSVALLASPDPATATPTDTEILSTAPQSAPASATPAPPSSTLADTPTPSVSAQAPAPTAPPPEALATFRPQISTLAGRVIAPRAPEETLVETPIGTLALPLPAPLPLGVGVQLRVTAIAPPQTAEPHAAGHAAPHTELLAAGFDTMPPTLVEELARVLTPSAPGAIGEIHAVLALDPGDGLAAAILTFLTGIRRSTTPRGAESPARRALIEGGRKDLADRLDRASRDIGTTRPPHGSDGWDVTILPFLGPASVRPMRLYRKRHDDKDADGKSRNKPSDRFMLEVELKRMGPLQFDGLVRERRFDLVVRSREPFVPPLQRQLEQAFQDGLLISGWSGEIGFGRIGTFPMMPDPESSAHLDLGA